MIYSLILFAQEEQQKQPEPSLWQNPIFLLPVLFFLFYFVVLLPQQRRQKREQEALFGGMKKNDKVMTAGGVIGVIQSIDDVGGEPTVTIKLEEGRMKVLKSSIVRILNPKEETKDGAVPPSTTTPNTSIKPA